MTSRLLYRCNFYCKNILDHCSNDDIYRAEKKEDKGKYGRQLNKEFDKITYNRRNIVETIMSVVKKKFGENRARRLKNQAKEAKVKLIRTYAVELETKTKKYLTV